MIPKKNNRITRREAAAIVSPIRKTISAFKRGAIEAVFDEETGREIPIFLDWQGEWSAVDLALRGWLDCWKRFATEIDLAPLEALVGRIEKSEPLYFDEIDAALAVLRKQEDTLPRMPKDFIKRQTDTELIQIELDRLGLSQQQ